MEEDPSDHDSVEDDVLRANEFRRGGGIELGQFMIESFDEDVKDEPGPMPNVRFMIFSFPRLVADDECERSLNRCAANASAE